MLKQIADSCGNVPIRFRGKITGFGSKPNHNSGPNKIPTIAIGNVDSVVGKKIHIHHLWMEKDALGNDRYDIGDVVEFSGTTYPYKKLDKGKKYLAYVNEIGVAGTGDAVIVKKAQQAPKSRYETLQGRVNIKAEFCMFGQYTTEGRWVHKTVRVEDLHVNEHFVCKYKYFEFDANWYGLHLRLGDIVTFDADVQRIEIKPSSGYSLGQSMGEQQYSPVGRPHLVYDVFNPSNQIKVFSPYKKQKAAVPAVTTVADALKVTPVMA